SSRRRHSIFSRDWSSDVCSYDLIFIYGLALSSSEGDTDLNSRYSNNGLTLGSADNPWLFRAGNQEVQQYAKDNKKQTGFIALERSEERRVGKECRYRR